MNLSSDLGNILVIDGDSSIRDLLQLNLRSEGYTVQTRATTGGLGLDDLHDVHIIIIDAADQEPSGLEFIDAVKSSSIGDRVGIIYCSKYLNESTLIEALDAGADDSVEKPFSLREMVARIRALMRRRNRHTAPPRQSNVYVDRDMRVDMDRKAVMIDNEFVNLSNTEYAILELLVRNRQSYTSRMEIFRNIWPEGLGANERIVDTNISRLRRKLGTYGEVIVNRTGLGYILKPIA